MSFLNHLKQRQAAQQAESNDAGIRKPRIPARLLLQSNTYASPVAGPLTAPYPQHHQQNQYLERQQQQQQVNIDIPQTNVDRPPHSPFSLIPPSPNTNRAFSSGENHQTASSSSYTGAGMGVGTVWESFRRSITDNGLNQGEFVPNSSSNHLSAHAHGNAYSAPGTPTSPAMRAASGTTMDTPQPCRTVYLGNLPADVTPFMVLDKVRCGVVEAYRLLPEKGCAFIAFVDPREAAIFHRESNQNIAGRRLIINGQEIKVAWGKPSPVSQQVMREINEHNATRNVFFGDLDPNVDTEERVKECMEKYGAIDTVRMLPEKRIAFVHMCTIADAIRAVKELSHDRDWQGRRINYGRDRCAPVANPTSASLRKTEHNQCESPSLSASLPAATLTPPPPGVFGPRLVHDDMLQQPQPQVDTNVLIHRLAAVAMRAGLNPSYALLAAAASGAGSVERGGFGSSGTPGHHSPDVSQRATPLSGRPRSMSARFHDDRLHSPMLGGLHSPAYPESLPRTPTSATGFGFESPLTSSTPVPPDGQSRTIYLGNLHAETTLEDLCNVIRGGGLEEIKVFPDRGISFVTFLETDAASQFVNRVHREGLTVRHRKVKAGWGRPTPALLQAVREAVLYSGASRNVYIGGLPDPDAVDSENDPWSVAKIKADFEVFGEVEMVNRPAGMDCAFVNFAKIQSAIRAVEEMNNGTGVGGGLMRRYEGIRVNYGKDRCANPPRPSTQTSNTKAPLTPTVHATIPSSPLPRHHSPQTMNCDLTDNFLSLDGHGELYSAGSVRDLPSLPGALPNGAIISSSIPKMPSSPRAPPTPTGNGRYEVPQLRRMRASTTGPW